MKQGNDRLTAYQIIAAYLETKQPLKTVINAHLDDSMPRIKRNFIYNLTKGTIKYLLFLDFGLSQFCKRKLEKMDSTVLILLRMAAYQLMFMQKVPAYSIVDQAVEMAKTLSHPKTANFVNAVLRRMSKIENLYQVFFSRIDALKLKPEKRFSLAYSYPLWLTSYWLDCYGIKETEKLCTTLNRNPFLFIRINEPCMNRSKAAGMLNLEEAESAELPPALAVSNFKVSSLKEMACCPWLQEGKLSIQDLSSQIAVKYFLQPQPGDSVLDLCAAPGGKALLANALMERKGTIVSVDISKKKVEEMKKHFQKIDAGPVHILCDDAAKLGALDQGMRFDRIFVDAPCSALGTISKNPDVKYNRKKQDLARLAAKSMQILARARHFLKSGGKLTYYTCTLSPIENQQLIQAFLRAYPDFSVCGSIHRDLKKFTDRKYLEIKPYYFDSEGGFACTLKKD